MHGICKVPKDAWYLHGAKYAWYLQGIEKTHGTCMVPKNAWYFARVPCATNSRLLHNTTVPVKYQQCIDHKWQLLITDQTNNVPTSTDHKL